MYKNVLLIGENLHNPGFGNEFLDIKLKLQTLKKIDKFIKIENFCSSNEIGKRMKTQATDWKKYLQNIYLINDYIQNI